MLQLWKNNLRDGFWRATINQFFSVSHIVDVDVGVGEREFDDSRSQPGVIGKNGKKKSFTVDITWKAYIEVL